MLVTAGSVLRRSARTGAWRTLQSVVTDTSPLQTQTIDVVTGSCSFKTPENVCQDLACNNHFQPILRRFATSGTPKGKEWSQRRLVGWSPEQFYRVVSDVQEYKHFVPWCQQSKVLTLSKDGTHMTAELEVGFQMLKERYISHVTLQPPRTVSSRVEDSLLFHRLVSSWRMDPGPSPSTCWLTFNVDFAFNNALYGHMADLFFSEVVKQMVSAFEGRAHKLYGQSALIRPARTASAAHAHKS